MFRTFFCVRLRINSFDPRDAPNAKPFVLSAHCSAQPVDVDLRRSLSRLDGQLARGQQHVDDRSSGVVATARLALLLRHVQHHADRRGQFQRWLGKFALCGAVRGESQHVSVGDFAVHRFQRSRELHDDRRSTPSVVADQSNAGRILRGFVLVHLSTGRRKLVRGRANQHDAPKRRPIQSGADHHHASGYSAETLFNVVHSNQRRRQRFRPLPLPLVDELDRVRRHLHASAEHDCPQSEHLCVEIYASQTRLLCHCFDCC